MSISSGKFVEKYFFYIALFIFTIPNLIASYCVELSFDESYYWIYSRYLDFGFFDHPPMVGLSIFVGTAIFGQSELGVRIVSNLYLLGTILLVWDLVREHQQKFIFWLLMFSMPLINLSGMVALPDTPLMFFSSLFFWFLPRYLARDSWKNALYLGLIISLMFYSKYHGLLIVLLTSFANPAFFKRKTFWGIIGVVTILFLPHVYWQYQHDFISFKFHLFQRVEKHFSLNNILDFIGGQIVLMGFLNFFLFCYIFYKNKFKDPYERILIFNSFGFLFFLFFMSFRNQIEANWTISCSIAFIILMVKYLAPYKKILIGFSIINIFLHVGLKVILFNLGPVINLMDQQENRLNEIWGWKEERIGKINQLCGSLDIVGDNYQVTSKMAFYNRNPKISALHLGSRESQYSILKLQKMIKANKKICYLTSKNLSGSARVETNYKDPVFVLQTTLGDLATRYGITYAEIIRSRN